jgi:hypothetical protein
MLTDSGLAYSNRGRCTPGRAGPQQLTENLQLSEFQTISPVNSSLPDFLKVPMVAMVVLLDPVCFRARTIAVSMVIDRPEAIAGAPVGRSEGKDGESDFVVSRGMPA